MTIASFNAEPYSSLPAAARSLRRRTSIASWQPLLIGDIAVAAAVGFVLPAAQAVAFGTLLLGMLAARGCYRVRYTGQLGALLSTLVTTVALATVALAAALPAADALVLVRLAPFVAAALILARALAGAAARAIRTSIPGKPSLIVGAGDVGNRLAKTLIEHPEYGLFPVGIVDDIDDEQLVVPFLGRTSDLADIAARFNVDKVIVAFGKADETRMVDVLRRCEDLDAEVWVVPRFFELGATLGDSDELWGVPISQMQRRALRTGQWRLKRGFDVAAALVLLFLTLPVTLAIAAAVRLNSPGPLFFRQQRIGQEGRVIDVLKFRTLRVADPTTSSAITGTPEEIQAARSRDVSARQTVVGNVLRRTSLDELPQLWNIVRGDLSLVGPRPEEVGFARLFAETVHGYPSRHRVPAGLTGLAQVNGLRGDTSIADRARFDNHYIDGWSLWGDLVILFRTVAAVVRPPDSVKVAPREPVDPVIDLNNPTSAVESATFA